MTSATNSRWRNVNSAYLVLALLPWLVLAVDSSWIYNGLLGIDQWIYFGYFLDYPRYVTHLYPDMYFGTRLSWILPGYALHQLFNPVAARYILHVGFYYVAVFSLYSLLRSAIGQRTALLAAVLFGTHSYFLGAIGWDYVDGAGFSYNLLALLCIGRAATSSRAWMWLTASGAAAAAMFYCNAFLIVFVPFLPAFYLYQVFREPNTAGSRIALRFALWFATGALLLTLILGAVSYAVGAGFWFYGPSLQYIAANSSKPNQWFQHGWAWARKATWLALPLMVALGSCAYLIRNLNRRILAMRDLRMFFVILYLCYLGFMIAWHLYGGLGLESFFYASYLLPPAFLALGSILASDLDSWSSFAYWTFLAAVMVGLILSLAWVSTSMAGNVRSLGWLAISVSIGLVLAIKVVRRGSWQILLLIVSGLCIYQIAYKLSFVTRNEHSKEVLLRMMDSLKLVRKHTGDDPLWFWYDSKGRFGEEFNSINSAYLWSCAIVSPDFPGTWPQHPLKPGTQGVILSSDAGVLEKANRALSPIGLQTRLLETDPVNRDGVSFRLFFFRAEPVGVRDEEVPLQLSMAAGPQQHPLLVQAGAAIPFSNDRWISVTYPNSSGHFMIRPDGVHITTHHQAFSYAAKYPVTVSKSGLYRFALEYEDLYGGFSFGCLSGDEQRWVAQAPPAIGHGIKGVREAYVSLHAGESVVLLVANYRYPGPEESSSFVLKSVRSYAAFDK